jgi:hypothetical protein
MNPTPSLSAPIAHLPRAPRPTTHVISNSMTITIDAGAHATRHALERLDLAAPALRALTELGLDDRVTLRPGGLTWHQHGDRGPIEVDVAIEVRPRDDDGSLLSITTRFSAADERARIQVFDAWALVGPVASNLAERSARTVKDYAERDSFDGDEGGEWYLRAA